MKIFRMNDCDWVAAETLEQATGCYLTITGLPYDEAIDDPWELGDEELDRLKFHFTDDDEHATGLVLSFRDALAKRIADGEKFPYTFASTEQ